MAAHGGGAGEGGGRGRKELAAAPSSSARTCYPTYEMVISDLEIFKQTLEMMLLSTKGTNAKIPIPWKGVGGLHRLFLEVTSRGGIQKVIEERRVDEVRALFPQITNASYLIEYYNSWLYDYEQDYFNGKALQPSLSSRPGPVQGVIRPTATRYPIARDCNFPSTGSSPPLASWYAFGVVEIEFDDMYGVTVYLGTEELNGLLYHPREIPASDTQQKTTTKRALQSAYNIFIKEQWAKDVTTNMPAIAQRWHTLTDAEKAVYVQRAEEEKRRNEAVEEEKRMRKIEAGEETEDEYMDTELSLGVGDSRKVKRYRKLLADARGRSANTSRMVPNPSTILQFGQPR